jgi:O-antigen/teichoic acid export membrane protein
MTIMTRILSFTSVTRFVTHLREPLYRNGYALVLSSAATSGLGMVYWIMAAHTYSTETIGLNSAAISAMIFLANMSQLNLMNALNRFLPTAGRKSWQMVVYAYMISLVMAVVTSLIFIFGIRIWAPQLGFLSSGPTFILWFIVATMTWCIFVLQDSTLIGLRQASWVPIENILFALAKIGLLIGLATIMPRYGVFVSWTLAVLITILPTNFLIFGWLLPGKTRTLSDQSESITSTQVVKYIAGDYFGSLVSLAAISLLPIIIVVQVGASANAYFYLSWTIAYALYLVSRNMGMSLITEAAGDQSKLNLYSYRTFIQTARLLVPLVILIVLAAPNILGLFGKSYSIEGATLLRLLCLSALPNMVTSIYTSVVRVQRRMKPLVLVLTVPYILVIALSYLLMNTYGVVGVGIAWLASQSLVAVILLFVEFRFMWKTSNLIREN